MWDLFSCSDKMGGKMIADVVKVPQQPLFSFHKIPLSILAI